MTDPIGTAQERELLQALRDIAASQKNGFATQTVFEAADALQSRIAEVGRLTEVLRPFAEAWDEAQPYADFDGEDRREIYAINAVGLSDFEAASAALSLHRRPT